MVQYRAHPSGISKFGLYLKETVMRRKLVAGNWKMNKTYHEAHALFDKLNDEASHMPASVDVMIAPPAPYLSWFAKNSTRKIEVGAQDVTERSDKEGAFTGETSAAILKSVGVHYAIVGHSERRTFHGEDDKLIAKKIAACLEVGLTPVYCCGEKLEEREANRHFEVVSQQINEALKGFTAEALASLVVAYEPVWAIGTGKTASPEQAQEMHAAIRTQLADIFGSEFASDLRILYGGSVKPENAAEIFSKPDVDGGLIGGASLKADDFIAIIKAGA